MDDLFTSEVMEEEGDQASFTSESGDTNYDTFTGFQEFEPDTIEMPEYGDSEQWGDESYTIYYPPYVDGSAITRSEELFTSLPTELPDQTAIIGSEGTGTEIEGSERATDIREDTTAQTTEDLETKEILRAILAKIPESKEDETTTETETTTEEPTETTTDPYIYAIQGISGSLSRLEERQETGIKNTNLIGVSTVVLLSALMGAFFVNALLGRIR